LLTVSAYYPAESNTNSNPDCCGKASGREKPEKQINNEYTILNLTLALKKGEPFL
tara:strand:+ start:918 stop:1082 length:165 start_codon:yes stop_codon:yes gene_type:complete